MSEQKQLVTIDHISDETAPAIYVQNGLKPFLQMVRDEVCGEVPDLSTRKGRDRVASLAALVGKRKAAVEKPGRDYLRRLKEMPKVVETELREFVTEMDKLRDETRRPLTEWEQAEAARIARHEQGVAAIKAEGTELGLLDAEDLLARIGRVEGVTLGPDWEEFAAEAGQVKDQVLAALREALAARQRYDAEQAELARLRREAEERAENDRIRLAQEQAVEAERQRVKQAQIDESARIAREQQAEREAAARREQELIDQAAAQEREAENQRLQLKLQAEQAERAREQAEADRVATEQRMEQERQAAARRQEEAAEQARQEERRRADAAAAEIVRQQEAREADKAHKAKINRAALEAFISGGMPEACAKQAVTLIAQRKIPNVSISY